MQGKKTVEEPHIFTEAVQDTSNGVGVKEQDGCSQDGGKHAVVQNSRSIDTHKKEGDGSGEVDEHYSQHCAHIDAHPLVCGEVTQPTDTGISLLLESQVQAGTVSPERRGQRH